jgi:hypothetical protein
MDFSFLLQPEFQTALSGILITTVTGVVGAIGKSVYSFIKNRASAQQLAILQQIAEIAVKASEQGAIGGVVQDKKAEAMDVGNDLLKKAGVKGVTAEALAAAIEAAVLETFNPPAAVDGLEVTDDAVVDDSDVVTPDVAGDEV